MIKPRWVSKGLVISIHAEQLVRHGGPAGLRDEGLLESALARPQQLFTYDTPDIAQLAAAYAWGLARNHPFIDGNKRTSFVVCLTFLALNGSGLTASDDLKIETWLALAEGSLDEKTLADWLRTKLSVRQ